MGDTQFSPKEEIKIVDSGEITDLGSEEIIMEDLGHTD